MHTEGVACFFLPLSFFFPFVTSSRRFNLGAFLFFFGPIFDAMFSRYDIILPPHASTVEAGVFCCGLGFGGVFDPSGSDLGVTLSSSRIPLEFAKGALHPVSRIFFFSFLLYDSIPSVTRCQKCTNLAACLLLEMVKATLGFCCIRSNILSPLESIARRFFFPGISGRIACLVGLETSLLSFLLFFFSLFFLMMNVCPLGSDDPIHFL